MENLISSIFALTLKAIVSILHLHLPICTATAFELVSSAKKEAIFFKRQIELSFRSDASSRELEES